MTQPTDAAVAAAGTARQRQRVPRQLVVRKLLAMYEKPRYLEVGVNTGRTFDKVSADVRVAVDPRFRFDHLARREAGTAYHQVTSDEYFGTIADPDDRFDVIFLDGLHTVEQTLRDLNNALHHLQPRGVILIDDVRPPSYLASIPDRQSFFAVRSRLGREAQRAWMGDVYRLVFAIDTFYQQLSYRTISDNHGQAVVWRRRRPAVTERALSAVARLTFEEFVLGEDALHLEPLGEILRRVSADLGLPRSTGES